MTTPATVESYDTVLLDVGGVLFTDPWEHLLLAPGTGVAAQLSVGADVCRELGRSLWPTVVRDAAATEEDWWRGVEDGLGLEVAVDVRQRAASALRSLPSARSLLALARTHRVGVITDNTAFWYPLQRRVLGLSDVVDPGLEFVSCHFGRTKRDEPGLFEVAADRCAPERTLVVDDRRHNLERAEAHGFWTLHIAAPDVG